MTQQWHFPDSDPCSEAAHDRRVQRRAYNLRRETALGSGCCPQCGRPRWWGLAGDGTERRGCRCGKVSDERA